MAQPPTIRRAWLTIDRCAAPGKIGLTVSFAPRSMSSECMVQIMTRGNLPGGHDAVSMEVVSDPELVRGPAGPSAYQVAQAEGFVGTAAAWLGSLKGADGLSAYQLARAAGYGGTQAAWLASLHGENGLSAYLVARANGYGGTETAWLASLKGGDGKDGAQGPAGFGTITTSTPTRALNSVFAPHATKAVMCSYSVELKASTPVVAGSASAMVQLLSDAKVTPTTERARASIGQSVGLSITINITDSNTVTLTYIVPPGEKVLLKSTLAGTGTATIVAQTEQVLG